MYEEIKAYNIDEMAEYLSGIILETKDMILKRRLFPQKETLTQYIKDSLNKEVEDI